MNLPPIAKPLRVAALLALWIAISAAAGCMTQRSNIAAPGTMEIQQRRAIRLDPYPNEDIAPEIVGGRPREYQEDRSEAERAKLLREAWWGLPF